MESSDPFEGLRPQDVAEIEQVEQAVVKQTEKRRRGRPRKIKTEADLAVMQEILQEQSISEEQERSRRDTFERISKYYAEFSDIFNDAYPKISPDASLDLMEIELNNVQTKVNQFGSSMFLRSSIKLTANAIETVGTVLPVVKLRNFGTVVEGQLDDYERLIKAIMLKRNMNSAAVEPEAALLALVVQSVIATHATNVYLERQAKNQQTQVQTQVPVSDKTQAQITEEIMSQFKDL